MSQLDIDGLTLRCARGEDDLPALARVRWACSMVDRVDPLSIVQRVPAAEDLRGDLAAEDGYDPRQDLRVAECSGLVTGYGLVTWWVEADGARVFLALGWVDPAWRKRGIGTKLLHWAERRCREIDAAFPGPGPAFYGGNASDTELDAAQLLRNEGYRVFFTLLEMGLEDWQDLPDPTLPSGFVSRPLSPLDLPGQRPGLARHDRAREPAAAPDRTVRRQGDPAEHHVQAGRTIERAALRVRPLHGTGVNEDHVASLCDEQPGPLQEHVVPLVAHEEATGAGRHVGQAVEATLVSGGGLVPQVQPARVVGLDRDEMGRRIEAAVGEDVAIDGRHRRVGGTAGEPR